MGVLFAWMRNGRGVLGLVGGAFVWVLSAGALTLAMQANLAASAQQRVHDFGGAEVLIRHLRGAAVLWSLGFTMLQLGSFLLFTFVLRAAYRLRSAVCFSMGAGFVMVGDVLGLVGLLVWLGMSLRQG